MSDQAEYLDLLPPDPPDFTKWSDDQLYAYQDELFRYTARPRETWEHNWLNGRISAIDDEIERRYEMGPLKPMLSNYYNALIAHLDTSLNIETGLEQAMRRHPSGKKLPRDEC